MTNMSYLELADKAAAMDFKWWFLALLVAVLSGGVRIVVHLVRRNDVQSQRMHESYDRNTAAQLEVARHLAVSSEALKNTAEVLTEAREEIRASRESRQKGK